MRAALALLISAFALCQNQELSGEEYVDDDCTVLLQGSQNLLKRTSLTLLEAGDKAGAASAGANETSQHQAISPIQSSSTPLEAEEKAGAALAGSNETSQHQVISPIQSLLLKGLNTIVKAVPAINSTVDAILQEGLHAVLQVVPDINETSQHKILSNLETALQDAVGKILQALMQAVSNLDLSALDAFFGGANQTNQTAQFSPEELEAGQFKSLYIVVALMVFTMVILTLVKHFSDGECARLIPLYHCLGLGVSLTGVSCAAWGGHTVSDTLSLMKEQGSEVDISLVIGGLIASFVFMIIVNALVVAEGVLGNGWIRKSMFGTHDHWFVQWMIGPGFIIVIRSIVWLIIFVHLLLSYVCFLVFILVVLLGTMCGSGAGALASINIFLASSGQGTISAAAVATYCTTSNDTSTAAFLLWFGCLLSVIGQIIMLSALAAELEDITQEMEHTWNGEVSGPS